MNVLLLTTTLTLALSLSANAATSLNTAAIDAAIGRSGQALDGGVYRVAFPRTDLRVTIGTTALLPGFALGGYAAFIPSQQGTLAVGDLVLLDTEIQPVMQSLERSGIHITAVHNHLRNEQPHVMYMHFMGVGEAATIAPQTLSFKDAIEQGLGRSGKVSGKVLSVSIPRAESVEMNGIAIPPSAGVATAINFEDASNGNVATTGDFVLIGSEVEPVQQALLTHGFEVTALHSHMIDDTPHLYYLHFWAVASPSTVATALKDALSHVHVKQ